jgi:hypothetical protein
MGQEIITTLGRRTSRPGKRQRKAALQTIRGDGHCATSLVCLTLQARDMIYISTQLLRSNINRFYLGPYFILIADVLGYICSVGCFNPCHLQHFVLNGFALEKLCWLEFDVRAASERSRWRQKTYSTVLYVCMYIQYSRRGLGHGKGGSCHVRSPAVAQCLARWPTYFPKQH